MKLLVLAADPVEADEVRDALDEDVRDAEILVVAPALSESGAKFWASDVDDAIEKAGEVAQETAESLREEGAQARARTGDSEPLMAIQDALATFPADQIVVFARESDAARYREENLFADVEQRFGVPVVERRRS